ncbi:MAG: hypothetical protein N2442_04080 [Spirochaetes bacterium]|nr:hypothetical protein [Spirochaetota bacterium]
MEGYFEGKNKGYSSLRELIHQRFSLWSISLPERKGLLCIERFLSKGAPLEYFPRIAVVKQFLEKNLPLSLEALESCYKCIEGRQEETVIAQEEKSRLSTDPCTAPLQTDAPLEDLQTKRLLNEFNRRKNRRGKWTVLPFSCALEDNLYHGCLRLYSEEGTTSKVVLSVRRHSLDGLPWYFVWYPQEPKRPLRMYPPFQEKESSIPVELLEAFRKKLRKIGFILDDNKNSGLGFDGFDEIEGNLQNIDVWI